MAMSSGISLANKCQLLFGFAVVLIVTAALIVPWIRTGLMVRDSQTEVARQLADAWLNDRIQLGSIDSQGVLPAPLDETTVESELPTLRLTLVNADQIEADDAHQQFLSGALKRFRDDSNRKEWMTSTTVN